MLRAPRTVTKTALVKLEGNTYAVDKTMAGQKVEVRYKPRALQSIQVWQNGRFVHMASLHVQPENIDFSKREQPTSVAKQTGLNLLDLCEEERSISLKERVAQIRIKANAKVGTTFSQQQCAQVMAERLGRTLREPELALVVRTWDMLGGMNESTVHTAMAAYIQIHGYQTHISFYLDAIHKQHIQEKRSTHD